jgi:predicted ATP-dependent endonuclease of OLD family
LTCKSETSVDSDLFKELKNLYESLERVLLENQADINLLFIEEPEAHTHPQMQYVFIKNIKTKPKKSFE